MSEFSRCLQIFFVCRGPVNDQTAEKIRTIVEVAEKHFEPRVESRGSVGMSFSDNSIDEALSLSDFIANPVEN